MAPSAFVVRDAEGKDIDKITAIVGRVMAEAPTYTRLTFDHEKTANVIAGAILKQPGWFLRIIATQDEDEPVGGICGICETTIFGSDKMATDVTMMIDAPYRGKCLKEFIQCCEEYRAWAIADGAKVVKLGVSSGIKIDSMAKVLEHLGYERIGSMHAYKVGA